MAGPGRQSRARQQPDRTLLHDPRLRHRAGCRGLCRLRTSGQRLRDGTDDYHLTNTTSASRNAAGTDTDNNSVDFTAGTPSPVNCGEECVPTTEPPEIGECGDPATFVHQIQGSGAAFDPAFGGSQTIEGVVTAVMLGGMFVQEEAADHDADPLTSEGIFVALGSATAPEVGSQARVAGTVQENFGRTELIDVTVLPCDAEVDPVESAAVSFPLTDPDDLERFEGMQVQLVDELVISEYFNYARFGEVVVAAPPNGWNRLYNPTAVVEPGAPAIALAAEYAQAHHHDR